jgi:hypothetical protein
MHFFVTRTEVPGWSRRISSVLSSSPFRTGASATVRYRKATVLSVAAPAPVGRAGASGCPGLPHHKDNDIR